MSALAIHRKGGGNPRKNGRGEVTDPAVSGPRFDEGSNVASGHVGRGYQLSDGGHNENSSTRAREVLGSSAVAFGGAAKTWPHGDRPRVMRGWMGSGHRFWMSGFFLGRFFVIFLEWDEGGRGGG